MRHRRIVLAGLFASCAASPASPPVAPVVAPPPVVEAPVPSAPLPVDEAPVPSAPSEPAPKPPAGPSIIARGIDLERDSGFEPTLPGLSADRRYLAVASARRSSYGQSTSAYSVLVFDLAAARGSFDAVLPVDEIPIVTIADWQDTGDALVVKQRVQQRALEAGKRVSAKGVTSALDMWVLSDLAERRGETIWVWRTGGYTIEAHAEGSKLEVRKGGRVVKRRDVPDGEDWDSCSREVDHDLYVVGGEWIMVTQSSAPLDMCTRKARAWILTPK